MIPKIIHYCWFGNGEKSKKIKKCMNTWPKKMPGYQIMEWSEKNFDIDSAVDYVKEAYEAKKYAFVSDYVRLWALEKYGGIYLDTDVEIIMSPDELLENASLVTGFETADLLITAFIACEKGHPIISEFRKRYEKRKFLLEDGSYDMTPINNKFTELMTEKGLIAENSRQSLEGDVEIYPYVVFCGYDLINLHPKIQKNTYTVHRFEASWKDGGIGYFIKYDVIIKLLHVILGYDRYDRLKEYFHL